MCVCVCVLCKQQLTMDKIYYSIEKTNPSSYRRGGPLPNCIGVKYENRNIPLPNCIGVKYENRNMVTGPDGALHQE
jgi:hypothetical protein